MTPGAVSTARDATDLAAVGFPTVLVLAAFAGAVDVCGLTVLKDVFVSFMSGNTTLTAAALADGDTAHALLILGIVALFVAGSAAGTVLAALSGRWRLPAVLLGVAATLALPALRLGTVAHAMAFAMGALNAALDQAGSVKVSLTYVTGTLVRVGQGLGRRLCGEPVGWGWLQQGTTWVGLLVGAVAARACVTRFPDATLGALSPIALAIAAASWLIARRVNPST